MKYNDLQHIHGLLTDMDGVWFVGDEPVPGAAEALSRLRARCLPVRFVTNTTTKTAGQLSDKMKRMGLDVPAEEFVTTPVATAHWLRKNGISRVKLVVADAVRGVFADFEESSQPEAVVLGDVHDAFTWHLLQEIFRDVMDGARLVAMHKGRYWQVEDGLRMDIGAYVAGFEYTTGKAAVVIGKPSPEMFSAALSSIGMAASDVVMIGDDAEMDVAGAQDAGIRGVLVKTGKYRDERFAASGVEPDLILGSIAELP
jgi:HAD superfamily hydrolase (TIGR01458 family)